MPRCCCGVREDGGVEGEEDLPPPAPLLLFPIFPRPSIPSAVIIAETTVSPEGVVTEYSGQPSQEEVGEGEGVEVGWDILALVICVLSVCA